MDQKATIEIRPVTDVADTKQIEEVQRVTWGMTDSEILPGRFLHALQANGACLLGAYDGDELIGFVFGVLGTVEGMDERIDQVAAARLQMYSAIMGVLPGYQTQGVGYRLKLAQREFALRIGVRLITWTYDPLESRNAYFNLAKLGVICHEYYRDYHGPMTGINAGLSSDRFYVEWWVTSNRVKARLGPGRGPLSLNAFIGGGAVLVNDTEREADGLPVPPDDFARSHGRLIMVEIPASFQQIKRQDMDLARRWRFHSRGVFEYYFDAGYVLTDFVHHQEKNGTARSFYVLTHMEA